MALLVPTSLPGLLRSPESHKGEDMSIDRETAILNCEAYCTSKQIEITKPPIMVKYFSAQAMSENLGALRTTGEYLIAYRTEDGTIYHFVVNDQSGETKQMEDL